MSNEEYYKIYLLQDYHRRRLHGRLGIIEFFLEQLEKNLQNEKREKISENKSGLDFNGKMAILQIGAISHIMMLIEDLAVFCISFIKNDPDYYRYLDSKGDDELGKIIYHFFTNIDSLKVEDCRKMLSLVNPDEHEFESEKEEKVFLSTLTKAILILKTFLVKTSVFRESHIEIFRRYKHATLPIFLGDNLSVDVKEYKEFDFVSFAISSKENPEKEMVSLPFSRDVIQSYRNMMLDIYFVLGTILNSRLIIMERNISGMVPYSNDYFSENYTYEEKVILKKMMERFEENTIPDVKGFHAEITPLAKFTAWYIHLNLYKKSNKDIIKEKTSNSNPRLHY